MTDRTDPAGPTLPGGMPMEDAQRYAQAGRDLLDRMDLTPEELELARFYNRMYAALLTTLPFQLAGAGHDERTISRATAAHLASLAAAANAGLVDRFGPITTKAKAEGGGKE